MYPRKPVKRFVAIAIGIVASSLVLAAAAEATIVTPPSTDVEAVNKTPTLFIPNNAYSSVYVSCDTSVAEFTTPNTTNDNNINRTGTGTFSGGPGSVTMLMSEPPTFDDCEVIGAGIPLTATVNTNDDNGSWSISALSVEQGQDIDVNIAAIGVPKEGAVITIDQLACDLTVSPDRSSVVTGDYANGDEESTTSNLSLDEQIVFNDGCGLGLGSPAQFEGSYAVDAVPSTAGPVRIDP